MGQGLRRVQGERLAELVFGFSQLFVGRLSRHLREECGAEEMSLGSDGLVFFGGFQGALGVTQSGREISEFAFDRSELETSRGRRVMA